MSPKTKESREEKGRKERLIFSFKISKVVFGRLFSEESSGDLFFLQKESLFSPSILCPIISRCSQAKGLQITRMSMLIIN